MNKILVSQCLYGDKIVRYDGGEKVETHPIFIKWKEEGRLIPVCPEAIGGLKVPRPDAQRKGEKVVMRTGEDVTYEYEMGAKKTLEIAARYGVVFAIMKENSPSCGVHAIHDGAFSGTKIQGEGMATELLRKAGFKIFSEEEMVEAAQYLVELEGK